MLDYQKRLESLYNHPDIIDNHKLEELNTIESVMKTLTIFNPLEILFEDNKWLVSTSLFDNKKLTVLEADLHLALLYLLMEINTFTSKQTKKMFRDLENL